VTGNVFPCGTIQTSNLSGGTIAGAFTSVASQAAAATILGDQAVKFQIHCE
jgi:hypothetical protein